MSGPHASIWFFCPSQSTTSGEPLGKPNRGLPSSVVSPVGAGLAEVQIANPSQPLTTSFSASALRATSTTTTEAAGMPPLLTSSDLDDSVRTMPTGANSSGNANIFRNNACPVCPPAPVTTILRTAEEGAGADSASAGATIRSRAVTAVIWTIIERGY